MGLYPAGCQCLGDPESKSATGDPVVLDLAAAGDGFEPLRESYPYGEASPESSPQWLAALAPGLDAEAAAQAADAWALCADDLRRRTRLFVGRAEAGVPCRLVDPKTRCALPARYVLDRAAAALRVEEAEAGGRGEAERLTRRCSLAEVQNIWVCSDSELACRALGDDIREGSADAELACIALIDVPEGPIGLVERSAEAREDFLDCMAVLVACQRLQSLPELASCGLPGRLPPPEARLRPIGRSLRSVHLSGPICMWLARAGEGLLAPPGKSRQPAATHKCCRSAGNDEAA